MGKFWTRNSGMSETERARHQVVHDPQPGDRCGRYRYEWLPEDQFVSMAIFSGILPDGNYEVYYMAGSVRGYMNLEPEKWVKYCQVGHRKEDFYETMQGKKKVTRRKEMAISVPYAGDGTFVEPPAPPPREPSPLPKPYDGPICGCRLEAPYPSALRMSATTGEEPETMTFTCGLLPGHEGGHQDPKMFVGWQAGFTDWESLRDDLREQLERGY